MLMVFSSNGAGRRPAPPLVNLTVPKTTPTIILNTPIINSYVALNRQGMLERVQKTTNCTGCGK